MIFRNTFVDEMMYILPDNYFHIFYNIKRLIFTKINLAKMKIGRLYW